MVLVTFGGVLVTLGCPCVWCDLPLTKVSACSDWWFSENLEMIMCKSGMVTQLPHHLIVADVDDTLHLV